MTALGIDLKKLREEKSVSLDRMAEETRISIRHLRSLEEGRYGDLPGGMYNRAFLRAYCEYLGEDARPYLERYHGEAGQPAVEPPRPAVEARPRDLAPSRSHPLAIWTVGLLLSVAGLYFSRHWISAVFSPYFTRPAPPVIVGVDRLPQDARADSGTVRETADPRLVAAEPPPDEAAPEAPIVQGAQGRFVLTVEVVDDCWVSLDSDGNRVLVRLLRPGEGHTYAADQGFFVVLGNAAGVHLKVNGMPLKPLGKPGSVVKLAITEHNLQELLAKTAG